MQIHGLYRFMLAAAFTLGATQVAAQQVSFGTLPAMQVTTPVPMGTHVPNDADGNGVSDIYLFNASTSQLAIWLMDTNDSTGAVTKIGTQTFTVPLTYNVGAIGDFNGDGLADVVITSNNHDLYLWTNNGQGGFNSTSLGTYAAGWVLFGAGDVDGDGQDDLLWFNATTCQFSYWAMQAGQHVGTNTISVPCGYHPLSIGYYTPSNRLSIIWTSAANDLQMWDSLTTGFTSYALGGYGSGSTLLALGGGYAGTGLSYIFIDSGSYAFGYSLDRSFDASGLQTNVSTTAYWLDSNYTLPWTSAGYLIEGRGTNMTGVIYQHGALKIEVCPPAGGAGFESTPAPMPNTCPIFSVGSQWKIVGAMGNGIVP